MPSAKQGTPINIFTTDLSAAAEAVTLKTLTYHNVIRNTYIRIHLELVEGSFRNTLLHAVLDGVLVEAVGRVRCRGRRKGRGDRRGRRAQVRLPVALEGLH